MKKEKIIHLRDTLIAKEYAVFLLFFALVLVLKIFYLFGSIIWRVDLLFYIQGAKIMLDGGTLYRDFVEVKPPGIFFLYYCMMKLFGYDNIFISIKGLALAFQTGAAFFFFKTGESLFDRKRGVGLGILFVIASSINWQYWPSNVMLLYLLPVSLCIFFLARNNFNLGTADIFLSTFFLSLSFCISTNVIFYSLIYPVLLYCRTGSMKETALKCIAAFFGFILPLAALVCYFQRNGALQDWYWWNVKWAFIYGGSAPLWEKIVQFFSGMFLGWEWIPLYAFTVIGVGHAVRNRMYATDTRAVFILLVAAASVLSRLMLIKYEPRYNLYLLPCFLMCPFLARWTPAGRTWKMALSVFVAAAFAVNVALSRSFYFNQRVKNRTAVYEWITANTEPGDKIFVWYEGYEFYIYSRRSMATSFFSTSQHLDCPWYWERNHYRDIRVPWEKFFLEFERDTPKLIIDPTGDFTGRNEPLRRNTLKMYMDRFKKMVNSEYALRTKFGKTAIWSRIH